MVDGLVGALDTVDRDMGILQPMLLSTVVIMFVRIGLRVEDIVAQGDDRFVAEQGVVRDLGKDGHGVAGNIGVEFEGCSQKWLHGLVGLIQTGVMETAVRLIGGGDRDG